ncbi:MAG: hypothetical protein ABIY52_17225 [Gemmatimonadaceae bacterium]
MTGAHLHLLVNHAPIFGAIFALALLVASYVYAPDVLRHTALVVLVATGIAGAAAKWTGDPAEEAIHGFPGVQRAVIHEHESMADKAFIAAALAGVLAAGALLKWRRAPLPGGVAGGALIAAAIVSGAMGYTGLLGGRVRHTEVRPDATAADAMAIEPARQRPPAAAPAP